MIDVLTIADLTFFWGAFIFMIATAFAGLCAIRLALKGETVTSLMGVSALTTTAGVSLYLIQILFEIEFARDTAIALLVLGAVGTIIFARLFRMEEGE
ncbi:MAG: monovalent cation/H+ antiporter complex subunit F [Candidatus Methanomethylicaceae archaeon]|nr:monovalent cation/H+ antiporter complex subunit F [Candidatus Verstraetearchaeota archaeon]